MGLSRQEYWTQLPCPPPGDLPDPGIEPTSPALQADSYQLSYQESPNLYNSVTENLASLYTGDESNPVDRILGDVEKV